MHFTGFAALPQTITALGGVPISLCFLAFLIPHAVVFTEKTEAVWSYIKAKISVGASPSYEGVLVFDAEPYAHISSQISNLKTVLVADAIAQPNIDSEGRIWVQDRLGSKLEMVCGASKVSSRIGQHFYPAFIRIVGSGRRASISNLQYQPRSIRVAKGFAGILSSFGNYSGTLRFSEHSRLPFNRSQSSQSGADTANPNDNQNPSGEVFWPESLPQICFYLLVGGVLLFFGA